MLYLAMLLAAAVGGVCRFLLSNLLAAYWTKPFPLPTLVVNLCGAFLLGLLWAGKDLQQLSQAQWQILALAALGSFTTVSSLSLQTVILWRSRALRQALLYPGISVGGGLLLLLFGSWCGQQLW